MILQTVIMKISQIQFDLKIILLFSSSKPLRRQSVPKFSDKTHAPFRALQGRVDFQEGTPIFIHMITQWFKMMDVKDQYSCSRFINESRAPCSKNCGSLMPCKKLWSDF